jgi:hypothetical protein
MTERVAALLADIEGLAGATREAVAAGTPRGPIDPPA